MRDAALNAARFTVRRQHSNGAWPYGEHASEGWIDNFHTGYVLVAIARIAARAGTDEFAETLDHGYVFWKTSMFLDDGTPKYSPDRVYPIDAHCVAQAVLTFLQFADRDPDAMKLAGRVLQWGLSHLQDPSGFFHYQILRHYRIRIPYIRWVQAWIHRALVEWLFQHRTLQQSSV